MESLWVAIADVMANIDCEHLTVLHVPYLEAVTEIKGGRFEKTLEKCFYFIGE